MTQLFNADLYAKKSYDSFNTVLKASNSFEMPQMGLGQAIDTLTQVIERVIDAKYYTTPLPLDEYVQVDASGRGAYAADIAQYQVADIGAPFSQCLINPKSTGEQNNATADIAVDLIKQRNIFYRQKYTISDEELGMAARNLIPFDIIEEKEKSRAKNWQLGFQATMFTGEATTGATGLLTQADVTVDTSLLPVPLAQMTPAQINTFAGTAVNAYGENTSYNFLPNRLYLPTPMYLALSQQVNPEFPVKNLRQTLEEAFNTVAGINDFKIVHAVYGNDLGTKGLGRAVLYNTNEDNIIMHNPLVYTPMPLVPVGALDMVSAAKAQFTGVWLKRPTTLMYLDVQAANN